MTDEEIKRIETRWKSDVDLKLDDLLARARKYDAFLDMLIEREKKRAAIREAIIEKTLSALILAGVLGLMSLAWSGLNGELKAALNAVRK